MRETDMDMAGAGSHIFPERVRRKEDKEFSHGFSMIQQDHCNYKLKIIRITNLISCLRLIRSF